jgi:hypothetical protein
MLNSVKIIHVCWCISNVKQMNCHVKFWMVRSPIWFWNNPFVWKKLITHGLQSSFRWYPTLSISGTERMTLLTIRFCGYCSFGKQGAKWWFHAKGKFINSLLMQTLLEVPAFSLVLQVLLGHSHMVVPFSQTESATLTILAWTWKISRWLVK